MVTLLSDGNANVAVGEMYKTRAYRCHVALLREVEGFSAIVLNLPGAASQGENEDEAIKNVIEATAAAIEAYLEQGEAIPWESDYENEIPDGAKTKWILVNV